MTHAKPILVVDDDASILNIVEMTLEDEGYEVKCVTDGAEALSTLASVHPALILLDMRMPVMNGWEFAEAYKRGFPERSPIVVMTAGQDAAAKCAEVGADGCLPKPFDLDDLISAVHRFATNGYA